MLPPSYNPYAFDNDDALTAAVIGRIVRGVGRATRNPRIILRGERIINVGNRNRALTHLAQINPHQVRRSGLLRRVQSGDVGIGPGGEKIIYHRGGIVQTVSPEGEVLYRNLVNNRLVAKGPSGRMVRVDAEGNPLWRVRFTNNPVRYLKLTSIPRLLAPGVVFGLSALGGVVQGENIDNESLA
jgi:hypothetical protein